MRDNLDTESLLLLYVADELSSDERAIVEQRLANEPALRDSLQQLTQSHDWTNAELARGDESAPLHDAVASAIVRRTSRTLQQAQMDQLARQPIIPAVRGGLPFGWRSYSGAAIAASLFICLMVWWGKQSNEGPTAPLPEQEYVTDNPTLDDDLAMADVPDDPDDERLAKTYGASLSIGPAEQEPGTLALAEQELKDLSSVGRGDTLLMGM